MTERENYISIGRRTGYTQIRPEINMCPSLKKKFEEYCNETGFEYQPAPVVHVPGLRAKTAPPEAFAGYFDRTFKEETYFDDWGVAHEPGSAEAFHMTRFYSPMVNFDSVEQILSYPFPDYIGADESQIRAAIAQAHEQDKVALGSVGSPVWEVAWGMRGMENLMVDMMLEDPMGEVLLNKVTGISTYMAECYARNGVDVLHMGDDIGMQHSIMMSEEIFITWLKPRLAKVIAAAKAIKPDIMVFYHSCGYIVPFIPHLIEIGVDVLDPVQPECMDFEEIHSQFGDKLSFHGTIGTQTTMPFGTPEDVRREVFKNLDIAGKKGGLYVTPSHLLEPEVPVENVIAYIRACEEYSK